MGEVGAGAFTGDVAMASGFDEPKQDGSSESEFPSLVVLANIIGLHGDNSEKEEHEEEDHRVALGHHPTSLRFVWEGRIVMFATVVDHATAPLGHRGCRESLSELYRGEGDHRKGCK
jgi:hypothetical protein